jgi:hypothetical protein
MPYIGVNLAKKIDVEKEMELKRAIAKAIEIFPGKTEQALMIDFEDGKNAYLAGERQENSAYIDLRVYGKFNFEVKSKFTAAMFELFESILEVPKDKMYLTILEYETWGTKGILK